MKKLLVLTTDNWVRKNDFLSSIKKYMSEDVDVAMALYDDLSFKLEENHVQVLVNGEDIKKYDLVYFRRTSRVPLSHTLAYCLTQMRIKYFDSGLVDAKPFGNKLNYLMVLAWAGLPILPTYFCSRQAIKNNINTIITYLGFPLVAKDLNLQRGQGIYLVKDESDLTKFISDSKRQFLFQKFIKSDEEYRVLILGNEVGVYEQKVKTNENEFRANAALGAREDFLDKMNIPKSQRTLALLAANALKIEIAGVDIMVEKDTGKEWLLEVNRGPGISYEDKNSPEAKEIAHFLEKSMA